MSNAVVMSCPLVRSSVPADLLQRFLCLTGEKKIHHAHHVSNFDADQRSRSGRICLNCMLTATSDAVAATLRCCLRDVVSYVWTAAMPFSWGNPFHRPSAH